MTKRMDPQTQHTLAWVGIILGAVAANIGLIFGALWIGQNIIAVYPAPSWTAIVLLIALVVAYLWKVRNIKVPR